MGMRGKRKSNRGGEYDLNTFYMYNIYMKVALINPTKNC
jgi:hypothetical protein